MNFRLTDTFPDLVSVKIYPTTTEKDNLEHGEWDWVRNTQTPEIHFFLKPDSEDKEICHQFRLLAHRTKRRWGKVPAIDFSAFEANEAAAIKGLALSNYKLDQLKTTVKEKKSDRDLYIISKNSDTKALNEAEIEAEVQMRIMELVDLPPNKKTPEDLGHWARASAKKYGYDCEVWNDDHVISAKLFALHAVGKGSVNDPVFIVSQYFGKKEKGTDLALVGKGVTFDTGGISIKPSANMHFMKCDMAGGAAVLGAIELAARLKLPINIAAIVPAAENSVDGNSVLPGEVINTYSGKTVEVIDTDAEGRLILADALSWTVRNLKPTTIVDMATLTGSSVRALGYEAAALYSSNGELSDALFKAGFESGDKCWPMPLWKDYDTYVHSDVADLANLPSKPVAGSIAAAKFLEAFTDEHPRWAHIDMPGVAFQGSP
ncbi:MAG TPA: leucyl aminopeptidase family protein, partial [Cryomorphaceae bacterium]|nr:leucyl aminopeptidase family protein [Cryomorphaceae bacterium]